MKKYVVKSVEFTPEHHRPLYVNGEYVKLEPKPTSLFKYFLDNAGKLKTKNEITDFVWGEGQHTHKAFTGALGILRKVLPDDVQITNLHGQGYVLEHKVVIEYYKYEDIEKKLVHSPEFVRRLNLGFGIAIFVAIALAIIAIGMIYDRLYPAPRYELENIRPLFTRDYIVDMPKLSPDGNYLAHRLSRDLFKDDHLGLVNLRLGDTKPIMSMGFTDGYAWDLTGERIVYQNTINGNCEIRLLTLQKDQQPKHEHLAKCFKNSGQLSFAWFNDNEFYLTSLASNTIKTANGLPLHHLYSFNIKTKATSKLAQATYQGGVGFYALQYDKSTGILHLLQSDRFVNTDFYQFRLHNKQLTKIRRVEHEVPYFTVNNNRLVYKNPNNQFVINSPADDFANQQVLARPVLASLNQPFLLDNHLAFVAGDTSEFVLYRRQNDKIDFVNLQGFSPSAITNHNNHIVFSSDKTGVFQVYQLLANGTVRQLSDMQSNERIQYMMAVNTTFVLSYLNKVDIYELKNQQLHLVKSISGYNHGVLNNSGTKLLLTQKYLTGENFIVEKQFDNLTNTSVSIKKAQLAFYHQNTIVYVNQHNELIRIVDGKNQVIAADINTSSVYYTTVKGDYFYYTDKQGGKNGLHVVNLVTRKKSIIDIGEINPTYIQAINDGLYFRARKLLNPQLAVGELVIH